MRISIALWTDVDGQAVSDPRRIYNDQMNERIIFTTVAQRRTSETTRSPNNQPVQ